MSWIFIGMLRIHLHLALDQLHRGDNEADDESRKKSILKAIEVAQFSFSTNCLIEFIRAEADCADERSSD